MVTVRIPKLVINGFLMLFGICLACFVTETAARFWLAKMATPDDFRELALYREVDPSWFLWSPHHYLNYYPSPNYDREGLIHNHLGFRGDEFSIQKPAGVFRIVVMGGSAVYTEKVKDNAKSFPVQLQNILRDQYGYQQVEVINAGVPGYTSWESLINLEFRVLDLQPDLVIIYHNTNDVHARLVEPSAYHGDNSGERIQWHQPPIPWWEYSTALRIISRRLDYSEQARLNDFVDAPSQLEFTRGDPIAALAQNKPIYFQRNLVNMIAIARANGANVMLATWAHSPYFDDYAATDLYQQAYREQNEVIKQIGTEWTVPVFDYEAVMTQDEAFWADGRHVNEAGALRKAELFAKFIDQTDFIKPTP